MSVIAEIEIIQTGYELHLQAIRARLGQLLKRFIRNPEFALQMVCAPKLEQGGTVLRRQANGCLEQIDSLPKVLIENPANEIFKRASRRRRTGCVVGLGRSGSR